MQFYLRIKSELEKDVMKWQFHKYFCDKRLLSISFPSQHFGEIFEIKAIGKYAENAWQYGNTSFLGKISLKIVKW